VQCWLREALELVLVAATAHAPVHAPHHVRCRVQQESSPSLTFFTHLLSLQSNASELQAQRVHASVREPTSNSYRTNIPKTSHAHGTAM
jgi:hypothetical protein